MSVVYSVDWLRAVQSATITAPQAARVLGVDPRTVHRMVARHELDGRRTTRILFVRVDSLIRFLDPEGDA